MIRRKNKSGEVTPKPTIKWKISYILWALVILLNGICWFITPMADFERSTVFRFTTGLMGSVSDLFSFSIGEIMLAIGVILLVASLIILICWIIFRKKERSNSFFKIYGKVFHGILLAVAIVMTLNCFILYHCTSFSDLYVAPEKFGYDEEHTLTELLILRECLVRKANELAQVQTRGEDGRAVGDEALLEAHAKDAMAQFGEKYPLFQGRYVNPKQFGASGFFSQQHMMGYYFPFSMEANYNGRMCMANVPATLCHELAHTKGFIYEDDANLIGYLACLSYDGEDADFFHYSGILSVLTYVENDLYDTIGPKNLAKLTQMSASVRLDLDFLSEEAWEEVEENAVLDTETVHKASDAFVDANQKANGISEGISSYSNVVGKLLQYYDGVLWE